MTPRALLRAIALVATALFAMTCGGDGSVTDPGTPTVTVTFSTASLTIFNGDTASVSATASNGGTVTYTSSNTGVATVTASGKVTGVSAGTAAITARAGTAEATLSLTVEALVPSVTIEAIRQNGVEVDPDSVAGPVVVTVRASTSNTFEGRVGLLLDDVELGFAEFDAGSTPATFSPDATHSAAAGALRDKLVDVAVSVTPIDPQTFEAIPTAGARNLYAILQTQPGVTVGQPSPAQAIRIRPVPLSVISYDFDEVASDATGKAYYGGNGTIRAGYLGWDPGATLPIGGVLDIESVEVLRGPQGSLFGGSAIPGVINIVTDANSTSQGQNGMKDWAGTYRFKEMDWEFGNGSTATLPFVNAQPNGFAFLQSTEFNYDAYAPEFTNGSRYLPAIPGFTGYFKGGVDLSDWFKANHADWTGTNPDIIDIGVGGVTCVPKGGYVGSFAEITMSDQLTESSSPDQYIGLDCRDLLKNLQWLELSQEITLDATAPVVQLKTGSSYFRSFNANPTPGTVLAVDGTDAGSGFDWHNVGISLQRFTLSGSSCIRGTDDGAGGCAPEDRSLASPGVVPDWDFSEGRFVATVKWRDLVGNSLDLGLSYTNDNVLPSLGNIVLPGTFPSGQPYSITADASDNLGLGSWQFAANYGPWYIGSGVQRIVERGSNDLVPSLNLNYSATWTGSIEFTGLNNAPGGSILTPSRVGFTLSDRARQTLEQWINLPGGASTGGRTTSFKASGMDWLAFVGGGSLEICSPKKGACPPGTSLLNLDLETRYPAGGSSDVTGFQLFAQVKWPADPNLWVIAPISDIVGFNTVDNGSWFQQVGNPMINLEDEKWQGILMHGTTNIYPVAVDKDNNYLIGLGRQITVKYTYEW